MSKSRALFCLLLSVAVLSTFSYAAVADRIQGAVAGGSSVALPGGGVHRLALAENDRGRVDPATQFGSLMLQTSPTPSQQKALALLLAQQQDRNSPNYHKWLTPEQWADRFGLSQGDIQRLTTWLKGKGFTIKDVARGRNWIMFSGTAAQVESAFATEIRQFEMNGELHVANASVPKIPAALAGIVTGIHGLDDFHLRPRVRVRPNYYDTSFGLNFIAPGDLGTLYDINPLFTAGIDGTGQKLAVIGQTDIYLSDLNDFRSGFGLSSVACTNNSSGVITACSDAHLSYVVAGGLTDPGTTLSGDLSEADVDLEVAGSVARNAQLVYVNAPATFNSQGGLVSGGVWVAWYWAVDNNLAPVITMSYGNCEFGFPYSVAGSADETELQKANSQGITFVNSSGDSGAAECDYSATLSNNLATQGLAVSYPASSPEVTGVGGTAIPTGSFTSTYWGTTNGTDGGSALSYVPEQPWNDDLEFYQWCQTNASNTFCSKGNGTGTAITSESTAQHAIGPSSTGGGASNCATQNSTDTTCVSGFPKPAWQTVTVSGQGSVRLSPDVSFLATPNFPGYIFCTQESELGDSGGGGSCANGISSAIELTPGASVIGGTSISTPVFAGMVVLLNQYLEQGPLGNVNPTLYNLAETPANGAFHPVTTGDNFVYCEPGKPTGQPASIVCPSSGVFGFSASTKDATTGYNLVTGLGSVDADKLAVAWLANLGSTFLLSPNPVSISATAGQSGSQMITITPQGGFSGSPTFSCSGLPSGATCSFNSVTATSATLVVQTSASTPAGTTFATVTGTSGTASAKIPMSLTVTVPGFSLSPAPASVTAVAGQNSNATTITITPQTGFTGTVNFTCSSGLPTGATCNFTSVSSTTATLAIQTLPNMAAASNIAVTIKGTSSNSSASATTTVNLTLTATNETFNLTSNLSGGTSTVVQGQTTSGIALTVNGTNGFVTSGTAAVPITYSCSGLPSESTCTFSPPSPTQATSVTLTVATTAPTSMLRNPLERGTRIFYALLLPGLTGIVLTFGSRRRPASAMRLIGLIAILGVSTLWLGSCGGGSGGSSGGGGNPGTPVGTYTVTVNAVTSGAAPITASPALTFKLTVNP